MHEMCACVYVHVCECKPALVSLLVAILIVIYSCSASSIQGMPQVLATYVGRPSGDRFDLSSPGPTDEWITEQTRLCAASLWSEWAEYQSVSMAANLCLKSFYREQLFKIGQKNHQKPQIWLKTKPAYILCSMEWVWHPWFRTSNLNLQFVSGLCAYGKIGHYWHAFLFKI